MEDGNDMNVYDFTVRTQDGEEESLAQYKGKVLLIPAARRTGKLLSQYERQDSCGPSALLE